jgi:predicted ferric reductase
MKKIFGWAILLFSSFLPVFLWLYFGPGSEELVDYSSITHSLGELTALVGMTMFALTFILSTRIRFIEDIFGGLDKAYISHGILGGTALIMILFHPILLVLKFIPDNFTQAALYLLPNSHWSVNFGIIALLGLISLISITLFTKIKYHKWKFSHEFLGLVFVFAVLHTFLVRGDASKDLIFSGYYIYAIIVSIIGLGGFSYSLFLKDRLFKAAKYRIKSIKRLNKTTFEIQMTPEHKPLEYKSGQFIFVRFYNEKLPKEAHPFSIASKSNNPIIKIIVKNLGDFTSKLSHLKVGDMVSLEGPYGRFNYKNNPNKDQVWVAGGIGITPFLGIAKDLITNSSSIKHKIYLFYSCREDSDFICLSELKDIEQKVDNFKVFPWSSSRKGYFRVKNITEVIKSLKDKEFYLCGPKGLKNSIIKNLIKSGVPKGNIHTEEFDFR